MKAKKLCAVCERVEVEPPYRYCLRCEDKVAEARLSLPVMDETGHPREQES